MLLPACQVVLLWNLDVPGGLANGTRGVVERFASVREFMMQVRQLWFDISSHVGCTYHQENARVQSDSDDAIHVNLCCMQVFCHAASGSCRQHC
jgi:hypothetical protein